jgi:hypothetical protein
MKFPVYAGILIKSCRQAHRILKVQPQNLFLQGPVFQMITAPHKRKNARDGKDEAQKGGGKTVNGFRGEEKQDGTDQVPVHSVFACKYNQISIVPA